MKVSLMPVWKLKPGLAVSLFDRKTRRIQPFQFMSEVFPSFIYSPSLQSGIFVNSPQAPPVNHGGIDGTSGNKPTDPQNNMSEGSNKPVSHQSYGENNSNAQL